MGRVPAALLLLALSFSGCRGAGPAGATRPAPTPTAEVRIAVVDVDAVARTHPRWSELDALNKKLADVDALLAAPAALSLADQTRLEARLRAQARKLSAAFRAELAALRERQEARLARYTAEVKADAEARLERTGASIDAELQQAVQARLQTLRAELRQYEVQVMEEYRFPIANLRLKADVVGVTSEEELRRLTGELDRLQTERDERVRARAEIMDVVISDFQKARLAEASVRLAAAKREAEAEVVRLAAAEKTALEAETRRLARAKDRAFQARLNAFRRKLLGVGEGQLDAAQRRYREGLQQRGQQLLTERQEILAQRLRLEDSILADVKIEVAALAAARGFDVVLTRYVSNLTGEDVTADVIARMKR